MVSTVAERWIAMRAIHETFGVGLELLCRATGRSLTSMKTRMRAENWRAPHDAHLADRSALLGRMSAMLAAQLKELECNVDAGEGADEKSVRTLGTLARTWEKLNALEQLMDKEMNDRSHDIDAEHRGSGHDHTDAGLQALRLELEKRIAALVDQKSADGLVEQAKRGAADEV